MTRYWKVIFKCDRPGCGAVYERMQEPGLVPLPDGWTDYRESHYCQLHRISVAVFDLVGEKGQWEQGK